MADQIEEKVALVETLYRECVQSQVAIEHPGPVASIPVPGRPQQPELVSPRDLPSRKLTSAAGHGAFIHALAHIEFNAINLALDVIYRFPGLPNQFYKNWIQVAAEEARHFCLLNAHLNSLGFSYGSFAAHNGLWAMAVKTESSLLLRMALVPRVLEARGLDVTPGMMERLEAHGDIAGAAILAEILADEVGHVAIGNRWYHWACERENEDAQKRFQTLLSEFLPGRIKGPFHREARIRAGFTSAEMDWMETL